MMGEEATYQSSLSVEEIKIIVSGKKDFHSSSRSQLRGGLYASINGNQIFLGCGAADRSGFSSEYIGIITASAEGTVLKGKFSPLFHPMFDIVRLVFMCILLVSLFYLGISSGSFIVFFIFAIFLLLTAAAILLGVNAASESKNDLRSFIKNELLAVKISE